MHIFVNAFATCMFSVDSTKLFVLRKRARYKMLDSRPKIEDAESRRDI
jgi:hypothetical protein